MKLHAIILTAAVIALATTPTAHADDADDTYLNALHSHGITNQNGDQAQIKLGHGICGLLADGYSVNSIVDMGELREHNGMSDDDMKFLVKAAAASYCPELIQ